MKRLIHSIVIVNLFLGCQSQPSRIKSRPIALTTTGMLSDAVSNIVGDKMEVEAIMGPGVDPHLYKATQGDLAKFKTADLIVYNGLQLEGKMSDVLVKLSKQKPVIAATKNIPDSLLISSTGYHDSFDPHVWFDVFLWKQVVSEISTTIQKLDTSNAKYYQNRTLQYLERLDSLDEFVSASITEIPEDQRILVTAHDAFGYFGKAYGLKVEAIQGISTVADFGLRDITNLIDLIIENDIKAIFIESSVSDKSIKAVIAGCKEKGHDVTIGGSLYSDAMGEWGSKEGNYIGMFEYNVNTIVKGLK